MLRNKPVHSTLRLAILALAAFVSCASTLQAQEAVTQTPPPYRGVNMRMEGIFVTPIPNSPLTAVVELQSSQTLPDGSQDIKKTTDNIARDSQGRIYNERRAMVPESYNEMPQLISFHIFDPTTRLNTLLDPETHLAHQTLFTQRTAAAEAASQGSGAVVSAKRPGFEQQDLGTESMENVIVHGRKSIRTVPASASGTGKPVVVTDEYWYSEELHLNMLVKHDDPRTGQQTVTVTKVKDRKS